MTTFDQIIPVLTDILWGYREKLAQIGAMIINRDLNGRVRLIVSETIQEDAVSRQLLTEIAGLMAAHLGPHAFPPEHAVLYEAHLEEMLKEKPGMTLEHFPTLRFVDRLATESDWATISTITTRAPRIVFYSLKGGVGRSTALAASAWALAQQGKRVLALDLDLESPGLSSALLTDDRQSTYGITDWLVEDLVDNGDAVFDEMVVISTLAREGEIYIVPAHGRDPGEYIAKLGRVWMPKIALTGEREIWSHRLRRLIEALETRWSPDVLLIDARAGIDEIASACITDLGANLVLLFAVDSEQTWTGYRILFRHWRTSGVVRDIRERLQLVGAIVPERDRERYLDGLRDRAWDLFVDELYDPVPPEEDAADLWSFDRADENAPHAPWAIRWHPDWTALRSLYHHMSSVDATGVRLIFSPLIDGLIAMIDNRKNVQ